MKECRGHRVDTKRRLWNRSVSLHTQAKKNRVHWSEGVAKAGDDRHERSAASKEGVVCASVIMEASESNGNENSEGLNSDKSV